MMPVRVRPVAPTHNAPSGRGGAGNFDQLARGAFDGRAFVAPPPALGAGRTERAPGAPPHRKHESAQTVSRA